ncbi:hypothetical protein DRN73_10085, partial [Candidatus Pacearchaeota archaeon]
MGRTRQLSKAYLKHLKERKENSEKRKKELIRYLEKLKQAYKKGIISYSRYVEIIHHKKDNRTIEEWIYFYHLESLECHKKIQRHLNHIIKKRFFLYLLLSIFSIFLIINITNHSKFIGFATQTENITKSPSLVFSDNVNLKFTKSEVYDWTPKNQGNLSFIAISGSIENKGEVLIYLDDRLIINSSNIKKAKKTKRTITALAIENSSEDSSKESPSNSQESYSNETEEAPQEDSSPSQES